jgi:hypothetical protein
MEEDELRSTLESILSGNERENKSTEPAPVYKSVRLRPKHSKLMYFVIATFAAIVIIRQLMCKSKPNIPMMIPQTEEYSTEDDYKSDPLFQPFD